MPIKFKCPKCEKGLSVKEELAGKRGKCPNCQGVFVVPALGKPANGAAPTARNPATAPGNGKPAAPRTAPPRPSADGPAPVALPSADAKPIENAEDLAAELLADKPEEVKVEFIEFNCPQCDDPLKLSVELGGKQTQCPSCRRIIRVPMPVKRDPTNWRQTDHLPTGAKREEEKLEDAWVPSKAQIVSAEALEEAGALPDDDEPLTRKQLILRGVIGVSALAFVVIGAWLIWDMVGQSRQEKLLDEALAHAGGEAQPQVGPEAAGALFQAAGEFYLRREAPIRPEKGEASAWVQFNKARSRLGAVASQDAEAQLASLALAQLGLAGDTPAIEAGTRLSWQDTTGEIGKTLALIRTPEVRREALRAVAREMIARGQGRYAITLAGEVSPVIRPTPPSDNPDAPRPTALSADGTDAAAVVGLELLKAGQQNEAQGMLAQLQDVYRTEKEYAKQLPPWTVDAAALYFALGQQPAAKGDRDVQIGQAVAPAWLGKAEEARQAAQKLSPQDRFTALTNIAVSGDREAAEAATRMATGDLAQQALSPWPLLALVRADLQNGVADDQALGLANRIREPALKGHGQLAVLRHRLKTKEGLADDGAVDIVESKTLAHSLARLEQMRHNSKQDSGAYKAVDGWDEPLRPFGKVGAALGLQGG